MSILKVLEILADSDKSWEDATKKAVKKASETVREIRSANVMNQSAVVKDGEVTSFRVNLKVTFEIS